jgi:hypothetical protein
MRMNLKGKLSKHQRSATQYFADKLISKQMQRNITIRVIFTKYQSMFGETEILEYNNKGEPREFALIIQKNISNEEILKTIAHELVHVKQYLYKELNEQMTLWKGRKVSEDQYASYYDYPWEKEAYKLGDKLFEEYYDYIE